MIQSRQENDPEEPEPEVFKEWLSRISSESRAYIKGASEALIYIQEISGETFKRVSIKEAKQAETYHASILTK